MIHYAITRRETYIRNRTHIAITGALPYVRSDVEYLLKRKGFYCDDRVKRTTDYLLASYGETGTTKYKKAIEYGIRIISWDDVKPYIMEN